MIIHRQDYIISCRFSYLPLNHYHTARFKQQYCSYYKTQHWWLSTIIVYKRRRRLQITFGMYDDILPSILRISVRIDFADNRRVLIVRHRCINRVWLKCTKLCRAVRSAAVRSTVAKVKILRMPASDFNCGVPSGNVRFKVSIFRDFNVVVVPRRRRRPRRIHYSV